MQFSKTISLVLVALILGGIILMTGMVAANGDPKAGPEPKPIVVDCEDMYAPACGGNCQVVDSDGLTQWGSCVLASAGGCACQKNPVQLKCDCEGKFLSCDDEHGATYGPGACLSKGSSCRCMAEEGAAFTCPPSINGTCIEVTQPSE
ncbi:MAG: hypothetical protein AABX02_00400 [archaeon]